MEPCWGLGNGLGLGLENRAGAGEPGRVTGLVNQAGACVWVGGTGLGQGKRMIRLLC